MEVTNKKNNPHRLLGSALMVALMATGGLASASTSPLPSNGQLVIINSLGNVANGTTSPGATASSVSVVVSDATGPCSTTASLAFNGTVTVKWSTTGTHSTTNCVVTPGTGITSIAVTPLKTTIGTVSTIAYDSVNTTTVPATTATSAITFAAPTQGYENMAVVINGNGTPSSPAAATATAWGNPTGATTQPQAPVFDTGNGALTQVGIPGVQGANGFKAERLMRRHGILPFRAKAY